MRGLGLGLGFNPNQQATAAAPGPFDGATLDFDPSGEELGAMGAVANAGSVVCDITQASTGITIAADGPNLTHYAKNPNASFGDYLTVVGKTMADFVSTGAGMIGVAMKSDVTEIYLDAGGGVRLSVGAAAVTFSLTDSGGAKTITTAYTGDTWRAFVMRWDGTNIHIKGDGGSWETPVLCGAAASLTGTLEFNGEGSASINAGCYRLVMFDSESEAAGDALLTALADLIAA